MTRRRFVQLGAAIGVAVTAGAGGGLLEAFAHDLASAGRSVAGGARHAAGAVRAAVPTTCLQCGVTDGVLAFVEDSAPVDASGNTDGAGTKRVVKLEGNPKNPNTCVIHPPNGLHPGKIQAGLCAKGQAGLQQLYDPFRIRFPMMRDPARRGDPKGWKRISWEQAVDEVSSRLGKIRESGDTGRFVFHQGRNRFPSFTKRFTEAFGTKHYFTHTSLCESSLKIGYEITFGADIDMSDIRGAKMHIAWGENIMEAAYMHNPMAQRLPAARYGRKKGDKGLELIAVDPRMSLTAASADRWIAPKVGTDAAIILAMCHVIMREGLHDATFLDEWTNYPTAQLKSWLARYTPEWAEGESGVDADIIQSLALDFVHAQPGYARAYNGLSNHFNGVQNARALALLNAVVGNIDKPGGFCLPKMFGLGSVEPVPVVDDVIKKDKLTGLFPLLDAREKAFPLAEHGADHLLPEWVEQTGYRIGLYMLHQFNPVYANPDRDRWIRMLRDPKKVAFTVDFSPFMSETVNEAVDLVIPDCTYLERLQVVEMPCVENFPFLQLVQPVVPAMYESRSMYDTMLEIARRIPGFDEHFAFESIEQYCRTSVEERWGKGSWERLKTDGALIAPGSFAGRPIVEPGKKEYRSFDQITYEELAAGRIFGEYERVLLQDEFDLLEGAGAKLPKEDGPMMDATGKKVVAIVKGGAVRKGFPTESGLWQTYSTKLEKAGFSPLPDYAPPPTIKDAGADDLVLITGKVNVHTQSRTANCSWLMEAHHHNPLWLSRADAQRLRLRDGDHVEMKTAKPGSTVLGASLRLPVHVTDDIRPGVVFLSTSLGHWEYGGLASKGMDAGGERIADEWIARPSTVDVLPEQWWKTEAFPGPSSGKTPDGRQTVGWSPNWMLPASDTGLTDPIGGEYAWSGTLVRIAKVTDGT